MGMGFDLSAMLKDVSNLDTGREQIEYIDIALIDQDPNNFYQLSRVDELAANIELLGLQQPIRVRDNPDQPGRVIIVSGHRRRAALQLLVDEGKEQYKDVPCIREKEAGSAALQELRLIYANADTRHLTSAELSKQVERVEALLYQLKEEGMEFPGRMRDHVAEACKVSQSKLARLKVIREKLAPEWKVAYDKDAINESVAYALAQIPAHDQSALMQFVQKTGRKISNVYENNVRAFKNDLKHLNNLQCSDGKPCGHLDEKVQKIAATAFTFAYCPCTRCCKDCPNLVTCKSACPKLAEKVRDMKEQRKFQKQQDRQAKEERERPHVEVLTQIWQRFGEARAAAGLSVEEYQNAVNLYHLKEDDENYPKMEHGEDITVRTQLPYCYGMGCGTAERLVKAADVLGCSLDYLFGRTDDPKGGVG
ncbi:ParB/RepB/Spo0J family partition protein [Candidatus Avoscillospira sp. LCP25S3_F1]|uniref:ParB/RepB/Spo0J family partition protein n=1 Tax=Candidatus Avoscillospira sp. LCP25S3_F1 TaxID=3438825 RepID=UPI003F8D954F